MAEDAGIKVETTKNAEHERSDAEANPLQKFFLFASWFISFSGWVIYLAGELSLYLLYSHGCSQASADARPFAFSSPCVSCLSRDLL